MSEPVLVRLEALLREQGGLLASLLDGGLHRRRRSLPPGIQLPQCSTAR